MKLKDIPGVNCANCFYFGGEATEYSGLCLIRSPNPSPVSVSTSFVCGEFVSEELGQMRFVGRKITKLNDLGLTLRTCNSLIAEGILNVSALCSKSPNELNRIPNIGSKALSEIIASLAKFGLYLKE